MTRSAAEIFRDAGVPNMLAGRVLNLKTGERSVDDNAIPLFPYPDLLNARVVSWAVKPLSNEERQILQGREDGCVRIGDLHPILDRIIPGWRGSCGDNQ